MIFCCCLDMDFNNTNENLILESSSFIKNEVDKKEAAETTTAKKRAGLKKDRKTICLLMYLYFLQGLPLGLAGSIMPIILSASKNKASFSDLGTYSFVFWPFSIKLLWAPLVDSVYLKKFGRRKSWLVPVQFLIGILMLSLGLTAQHLIYNIQSPKDIIQLTFIFGMFTFLAATQDIAVDGWAINMLSK